jgi:hypothetical protein
MLKYKLSKLNYKYTILLTFVSLLLFWSIFTWFSYLVKNFYIIDTTYIKEGYSDLFSHSVDLPINTKYSCSNFCGPNATCAITGEQCLADIDCFGCQPPITKPPNYLLTKVVSYFGSGPLIYNQNPQYSKLTTDIGTRASFYTQNSKNNNIPKMYLGLDKWTKSFNYGLNLADDKLTQKYSASPNSLEFIPKYPITKSVTGLFYDTGPTASNASL